MENLDPIGYFSASVLFFLSALHIYWAFGGKTPFFSVVPELESGPAFRPGSFITIMVAIVLFGFGAVALWSIGSLFSTNRITPWLDFGIAFVFFARALGDFRLVGFFKRMRNSRFAGQDTWIYSPLCVILGFAYSILGYCTN
ncbi:DUF3995 domain-containing protein [Leptospira wolffii]|uniref:DUF3995 domain-containing protein n=1 Tax=Leptospira wolffii TaxID=409998 RepID=A0ABV5BK28_9LEPT